MSSVSGKCADFDILSPTQCSDGSSYAGSEESLEPDGDETGYINQTVNEESDTTKIELESATADLGESALGSLPSKSSDVDEDKDEDVTTTTPVVLIPAIKGSREKHGLTLRKTNISWADDVYDPPPSIASHTKKQQQQKSKSKDSHRKNGKKGQKGKDNSSSRSGKDKKQASRKHSREKFDWVTQMPIVAASS